MKTFVGLGAVGAAFLAVEAAAGVEVEAEAVAEGGAGEAEVEAAAGAVGGAGEALILMITLADKFELGLAQRLCDFGFWGRGLRCPIWWIGAQFWGRDRHRSLISKVGLSLQPTYL